MADVGGNKAGRPDPGRPPVFIPSYDAPTTPLPRVRPGDPPPRPGTPPQQNPSQRNPSEGAPPGSSAPPAEDSETTAQVRRREVSGPFPSQRPFPPDQLRPGTPRPGLTPAATPGRKPRGRLEAVILRVGDIPLRAVYTVAALIATVAAVVLVFTLFSEDTPPDSVNVDQAGSTGTAGPSGKPSATPTPSLKVPALPRSKVLPVLPGTAAVVAGNVVDQKAGLTYAQLGAPWVRTTATPFTAAQRAGSARSPRTLIASGPLPGTVPASLSNYTEYRRLAARTARWTLRYQPAATKLTWTASQPAPQGFGWMVGYRVSYLVNGKTRASQAIVVVVSTGKKRPGVLFATVADSRKSQYRDLNTLVTTVRRAA